MGRILTKEQLEKYEGWRTYGMTVVTTNGAFDILHRGHLALLEQAKEMGHILVVGVNSDSSIQRYKSPHRPINPQNDRAYLLSRLNPVNYVYIFDETEPTNFLRIVKPDVHVKSKSGYKGIEEHVLKEWGGELRLIDDIPDYSTTRMVIRILGAADEEGLLDKFRG
jgi:rfaE bifunctional protein nucleotidyltransferase chain/domain